MTPLESGGFLIETEPEFDDEQRELLLASRLIEADTGRYGESQSEAFSPDADPNNPKAKIRYKVGLPSVNFAEKAVQDAQDAYRKKYPDANTNGFYWIPERVEVGR